MELNIDRRTYPPWAPPHVSVTLEPSPPYWTSETESRRHESCAIPEVTRDISSSDTLSTSQQSWDFMEALDIYTKQLFTCKIKTVMCLEMFVLFDLLLICMLRAYWCRSQKKKEKKKKNGLYMHIPKRFPYM